MLEVGLEIAKPFSSSVLLFSVLYNLNGLKTVKCKEAILILTVLLMLSSIHYILDIELVLITLVFISMFLFSVFKINTIIVSLLLCSLSLIVAFSIQSVVATIYSQLTSKPVSVIHYDEIAYWSVYVITSVVAYVVSKFLGKVLQNFFNSSFNMMSKKSKKFTLLSMTILSILLLVIIYSITFLSTPATNIETLWFFNTFLLLIICIFVVMFCYGFFVQMFQSMTIKHNEELLKNLQTYNVSIENLYIEMRHFRHDTTNILSSAYKFIDSNDFAGWKAYFEKDVSPLYKNICQQSDMFQQFENISSNAVKGLLMLKTLIALDIGSHVKVGIDEQIDNIGVTDIDMIRMLGIIFDNAIDEARKKVGTEVHLAIIKRNNNLTIHISNEFHGEQPKLAVIFENGYSTKGNGRGVGLNDLRRLTNNYDTVFLQTYIDGNKFVQELNIEI